MLILAALFLALATFRIGSSDFETLNTGFAQLQSLCSQGYSLSHHRELVAALVCGQTPSEKQILTDWSNAGLLPILIGAGTHFIFLEQFLNRLLRYHPLLLKTSLFLFVCITGFSPALTRSLVSQGFQEINSKWRLGLGYPKLWALSLLGCLMICPQWSHSIGFIISAQCALFMYLSFSLMRRADAVNWKFHLRFSIVRIVIFFFGLVPLLKLLGLPVPQPAVMVLQFFAIPIAGIFLFPLGVVERLISILTPVLDPFWGKVEMILHHVGEHLPAAHFARIDLQSPQGQTSLFFIWSYVASFFFLSMISEIARRSRTSFFMIKSQV